MNWKPLKSPSGLVSFDEFFAVGWIACKSLQVNVSPHPRSSLATSWAQGPSGCEHGLLICLAARASQSLTLVDGAQTLTLIGASAAHLSTLLGVGYASFLNTILTCEVQATTLSHSVYSQN